MAFGYYGLAWSVYSSVIGRGGEIEFEKNAMMDIKFGADARIAFPLDVCWRVRPSKAPVRTRSDRIFSDYSES